MKKAAAYPYALWMVIFIVIPIILIIYYSLSIPIPDGTKISLDNFKRALEPLYLKIIWDSFVLSFVSTVICFILGYPVAYILASKEFSTKTTLLFLFLVPMWMNLLLRTYSWLSILEKNGILNSILSALGFSKINFLYTNEAVILGMVYNFLPFMILPIFTVLKKMDTSIIEAAQDLGASSAQIFCRVVFPLSLPGVMSGVTMVFLPAASTFVISDLLGGNKTTLIGNLIEQQFLLVNDWNFGSALSMLLMFIILITMYLFSLADNEQQEGGLF